MDLKQFIEESWLQSLFLCIVIPYCIYEGITSAQEKENIEEKTFEELQTERKEIERYLRGNRF